MLKIYTDKVTPRIEYTFRLIFDNLYKTPYKLVTKRKNAQPDQIMFSYAAKPLANELFFKRNDLLLQNKIEEQNILIGKWNELPVFFMQDDKRSLLPFDPFAMIFYLVTSYEEYLPDPDSDQHGRRKTENSLAYECGFHHKPMVNILAKIIIEKIAQKYPDIEFRQNSYLFTPTYDIDMAFAHLAKGFLRTLGGYGKLLLKLRFAEILNRTSTLLGFTNDPFLNFEMQYKLHEEHELKPLYFVNLGDLSRYDKNASYRNKKLRKLLKEISEHAELGIHPSYFSDQNTKKIEIEKQRLEDIIGKKVNKSRQHFLKLNFPETYRSLIKSGIREDYSMGYPSDRFSCRNMLSFLLLRSERRNGNRFKNLPFCFYGHHVFRLSENRS